MRHIITKWEDCPRDDLNMIPTMQAEGWTVEFDERDKRNGRTTFDNVPHNGVMFSKDYIHVWPCINGWQSALLINGGFIKHGGKVGTGYNIPGRFVDKFPDTLGYIPTLKEVLELEKQGAFTL